MNTQFNPQNIQRHHIDRNLYILDENDAVKTLSKKQFLNLQNDSVLATAEKLIVASKNPKYSVEERRILATCAYDYLKSLSAQKIKTTSSKNYNNLLAQSLLEILGRSDADIESIEEALKTNSDWIQFILSNNIHYITSREPFDFAPQAHDIAGKICIKGIWQDMASLDKIPDKEKGEISFCQNGTELFKTDMKFKLKEAYFAGNQGILNGSSTTVKTMDSFFKREPTQNYWVNVIVMQKDSNNLSFGQSHGYLALEDAEGNLMTAGQYGMKDDPKLKDALTIFGQKTMGIETPERYSSIPLSKWDMKEVKMKITQEQYNILKESIAEDKEKGVDGSLLRGNCTSYVRKKLSLIGIASKTEMTVQGCFGRKVVGLIAPKSLQGRLIRYFENPPWLGKILKLALHSLIYVPTIIMTLGVRALSGTKSDLSVIQAIFTPWKLKIDHPIALSEWLDEGARDQKDYEIFKAVVRTETIIGQTLTDSTQNLGFKLGEETRVNLKNPEHRMLHPINNVVKLVLYAIYNAIQHKIETLWNKENTIDRTLKQLYLHGIKARRFH